MGTFSSLASPGLSITAFVEKGIGERDAEVIAVEQADHRV